jgi:hypothetical protein
MTMRKMMSLSRMMEAPRALEETKKVRKKEKRKAKMTMRTWRMTSMTALTTMRSRLSRRKTPVSTCRLQLAGLGAALGQQLNRKSDY